MSAGGDLPELLINCLVVVLGLIVGSFLNVVVARLPHGESVVRPRSRCPGCGATISWYDNVPVLSWLALRGRCRGCRRPISVRYPVIELITALLFLAVKLRFGLSLVTVARDWPFVAMLVAITFIDLEHRIVPDELSLGGLALGLLTSGLPRAVGLGEHWTGYVGGAALGFALFWGLSTAYFKLAGRHGLGGGDVKLLAMLGAFIGPVGVVNTIVTSSLLGSVVGLVWGAWLKWRGELHRGRSPFEEEGEEEGTADAPAMDPPFMQVAIPFGPFLVVGALFDYLLGRDLGWRLFTLPL